MANGMKAYDVARRHYEFTRVFALDFWAMPAWEKLDTPKRKALIAAAGDLIRYMEGQNGEVA
jgi:hypothetical protein